ncbi:MAG: midcut-by-XrtH protein [Haliea sp.]|uniref:midcut-by-XrtH protein n=1 Tax=Haliea sp. TaxID=1932666 RepID=UPI0032EBED75
MTLLANALSCRSLRREHILGLAALVTGSGAWAGTPSGGSITYGPLSAAAVPTMGGFALILLAVLMLLAVARLLRDRQLNGSQFMLAALVTGAIASGASGIRLVSEAYADRLPNPVSLDNPAGGTRLLGPDLNCVTNSTGIAQQILDIQLGGLIANNGGGPINGGMENGGASYECPDGSIDNAGTMPVPECSDAPPTVLQPDGTCAVFNSVVLLP